VPVNAVVVYQLNYNAWQAGMVAGFGRQRWSRTI